MRKVLYVLGLALILLCLQSHTLAQKTEAKPETTTLENLKKPVTLEAALEQKIRAVTVFVEGEGYQDSATSIVRSKDVFLWVPAHFVEPSRTVFTVTDLITEKQRKEVHFGTIAVRKLYKKKTLHLRAKVIRYDRKRDIAVLRVATEVDTEVKQFASVKFGYLRDSPQKDLSVCHLLPTVGDERLLLPRHIVGGTIGRGLEYGGQTYAGAALHSIPGSGGGCVFCRKTGEAIGMIVLCRQDGTGTYFVSSREMLRWAKAKGVAWAIDSSVPMPSEEELKKLPIED